MTRRFGGFLIAGVLVCGAPLGAQTPVPDIAFDGTDNLLSTPADFYVGEVAGVGTNSQGQIFVYTRTGHPYATLGDNRTFSRGGSRLFQFDRDGAFVRELGQDVYGFNAAIGLRVDPQDNVWTIDAGRQSGGQVRSPGADCPGVGAKAGDDRRFVQQRRAAVGAGAAAAESMPCPGPGSRDRASVSPPTWPGIGPATSMWLTASAPTTASSSWPATVGSSSTGGPTGSAPGEFNGVKGLAIDAQGNVYVADVGNRRIQVFDADGTFKSQFGDVGTPQAICMTSGPTQYLYVSHVGDESGMEDATILQGAAGRPRGWQVRFGRQAPEGVRPGQLHRLQEGKRTAGRRDDELARAEGDAGAVVNGIVNGLTRLAMPSLPIVRRRDVSARSRCWGACAVDCWQRDVKTLRCSKLQPK